MIKDSVKMMRETFCFAQFAVNQIGGARSKEHSERLQRIINTCDELRPLGPDGKHGYLHTPNCGCDK
jgi:hypothetical protein